MTASQECPKSSDQGKKFHLQLSGEDTTHPRLTYPLVRHRRKLNLVFHTRHTLVARDLHFVNATIALALDSEP